MRDGNIIREKSYAFALRIVKMYKFLVQMGGEQVLIKQVLRSGTSIGANVEEALGAQSRKDFFAKLSIVYKESRETHYWLRLLRDAGVLSSRESESLLDDCDELLRLSGSIIRTLKRQRTMTIPPTLSSPS